MKSFVVATAGHVDHGKSTLVRALTGTDPDRWAEEKRRGLTIDLGFAHTELATFCAEAPGLGPPDALRRRDCSADVAFVDVPGHERFLANMLAGLGPAPVVMFVVAADQGWSAQSSEHRDAIAALGIEHGLVVLTRSDLGRVDGLDDRVRAELAETGLYDAARVAVSAVTGQGMNELRQALAKVLADLPTPDPDGHKRLWIDRSFTINGAGTVVTGTLTSGTLRVGDSLVCAGESGPRAVSVRGLQHHGSAVETARPTSRVAINLRGISAHHVHRGDVLLGTEGWPMTSVVDVRIPRGLLDSSALTAHLGTAAVHAQVRPFDDQHARLRLERPLPLARLDRLVLRDPGNRVIAGAEVLDLDPPALTRRGDGARRAAALARGPDAVSEIERRGAVRRTALRALGFEVPHDGVRAVGDWLITEQTATVWAQKLTEAVAVHLAAEPLSPGLSHGAALATLPVRTDASVLAELAIIAGLSYDGAHLRSAENSDLGAAEPGIAELEHRLTQSPFDAPDAQELSDLGLGTKELAAAERAGRLIRLDGIVLLPTAPATAMRVLSELAQPFSTSQARQALGTTRRVAIPLLEHLDRRGWTKRGDSAYRGVPKPGASAP